MRMTGAPKTALVNDFLSAIGKGELSQGIKVVQKASAEGIDMKLYFKLIITKFRVAIILRYAPKLRDEFGEEVAESDMEFLGDLVKEDKAGMFRSEALAILLEQYQNMDNAFIAELPLELALVKILSKNGE